MPPLIEPPPQKPDGLASIESRIEANSNELSYLRNSQHNISLKLDTLQASQQGLLKKLDAIESGNYIQEINSLKAEKQLLQTNSAISTGDDLLDFSPTPSSRTMPPPSSKNKRKAIVDDAAATVTRRVKTDNTHLVPNEDLTTNLAIDTPGINPPTEQPRDADTGSSEDLDVVVWVDLEESDLYIYHDETDAVLDTWDKDSKRLREEWKKQLKEFNKKDPDWHKKAKTDGCVRSVLWNSKCYLTINAEGRFACKTCWNTNHFCVAWDEDEAAFWLREQLPAARCKEKRNIGPFDLEMFRSMKASWSRKDMPAYWSKTPTA